jgi:hypothetical protein
VAICGETIQKDISIDSSILELNISDSEKKNTFQIKALPFKKVLSFVSDTCIFSKVETIMLARQLLDMNVDVLPLVVPLEPLSESLLLMDRMFTGELYFAQVNDRTIENFSKPNSLPLFALLDESNDVIKATNNRNDILNSHNN